MAFSFKNSKRNKHWTDEERLEILELNKQNVATSEIAKNYKGRTQKSIMLLITRMGWKVNNTD